MPGKRVLIAADPFRDRPLCDPGQPWTARPTWPAAWIAPEHASEPLLAAYRLRFRLESPRAIRIHVSADERYELWLDGERLGRGPERCDRARWAFESYDLELAAGEHLLAARAWSCGKRAPWGQVSVEHGFLCCADVDGADADLALLATGHAPWQARRLDGWSLGDPAAEAGGAMGCGPTFTLDAAAEPWGWQRGADGDAGWTTAVARRGATRTWLYANAAVRWLTPATLPPMISRRWRGMRVRHVSDGAAPIYAAATDRAGEHAAWQALLDGRAPLEVPAGTKLRVLIDLGDYLCAYPRLTVDGGAGGEVRLAWVEVLGEKPGAHAGDRVAIEGRVFAGYGDRLRPDGGAGRVFAPPWWRAGRFAELTVVAGAAPLRLAALALEECRYPLDPPPTPPTGDEGLDRVLAISLRTLQLCAHETYVDCPYWEQLMYAGDTRVQMLCGYALDAGDRLQRNAIAHFDASRLNPSGLSAASHPSSSAQIIPPFALWWVAMLHDLARWRGARAGVAAAMPGARAVVERFLAARGADGLARSLDGWNYVDLAFPGGVPAGGESGGVSPLINWQLALALGQLAELERWLGERELAARAERLRGELARALIAASWDERRGLFADDLGRTAFSEHAQCLAALSGALPDELRRRCLDGLFTAPELNRTQAYFSHYLFEACALAGRAEPFFARLEPWREAVRLGMRTTPESFGGTRSDCHAWSAHPLFHWQATVLGVRPDAFGFTRARIAPLPGPFTRLRGRVPHPRGEITVALERHGDRLRGTIALPEGIDGTFIWRGREQPLRAGEQRVEA